MTNHYIYKVLTLRHLFLSNQMVDKSVLIDRPIYSNYIYEKGTGEVEYIASCLQPSKTRLINHLDLKDLNTNCYLELTPEQAKGFGLEAADESVTKLFYK